MKFEKVALKKKFPKDEDLKSEDEYDFNENWLENFKRGEGLKRISELGEENYITEDEGRPSFSCR